MRLLVTRPEPDATTTAARLASLGHEVMVQPMMRVEFNASPEEPGRPAAILVTSRNALRALGGWPQTSGWMDVPVYVVGKASEALAWKMGFADVRTADGDAAALADRVRGEVAPDAGDLLYPAARDRAIELAAFLADHSIVTVEAYRGVAAEALDVGVVDVIRGAGLDGILFMSRRTASIFADLAARAGVADSLNRTTFYALSQTAAEPLGTIGARDIRIAARPDEDSLIALVAPAPGSPAVAGRG